MTTFKINAQRIHDGYVTHFNALWGPTVTIIMIFLKLIEITFIFLSKNKRNSFIE